MGDFTLRFTKPNSHILALTKMSLFYEDLSPTVAIIIGFLGHIVPYINFLLAK